MGARSVISAIGGIVATCATCATLLPVLPEAIFELDQKSNASFQLVLNSDQHKLKYKLVQPKVPSIFEFH